MNLRALHFNEHIEELGNVVFRHACCPGMLLEDIGPVDLDPWFGITS
jgi:hypothetical protein